MRLRVLLLTLLLLRRCALFCLCETYISSSSRKTLVCSCRCFLFFLFDFLFLFLLFDLFVLLGLFTFLHISKILIEDFLQNIMDLFRLGEVNLADTSEILRIFVFQIFHDLLEQLFGLPLSKRTLHRRQTFEVK